MKKAVVCLRYPLSDKVVREVAIIAYRHVTVAALLPRVEVFLHHMAVNARLRVVAQVACSFAVTESERPNADEDAKQCHGRKRTEHDNAMTQRGR